ncbi:hypothetical protein I203_106098 [Kwoniella mangroviensis CBS 8507]|uniref:uncharacterized protein n=1 Tax=Kwoniella mangroviensis CBS 8507 TaxID=1296122 RepID=UPI00303A270A
MIGEGPQVHPVIDRVKELEIMDRTVLEDELRAWLKRTYPDTCERAKSVAAATIGRLRELIDEGSGCLSLEDGFLRKVIPGTTAFADALLEEYDTSIEGALKGDQMLLAIGLDKNPQLCDCFHDMSRSTRQAPIIDAPGVRSASKTLGKQTYTGVYLLDFLLNAQGKKLHMRVLLGWPRGKCPKLATLAWETYMICALQTYKGDNKMQMHSIGGLLGPGIAIKHFRPAYLRYVKAARAAAATHDLPPIRCFKIMNPYPDELDISLKFYTELFEDLIQDSGIDPMRFIQLVVGTYQGDRNRMLTREMQKEGYVPPRLAHPQARALIFGKKYEWEPGMKGMDRRALALTKEFGVAKPARTLRLATLPPLPPDHLEAMIAKYRKKAELLKMIYPPPEMEDAGKMTEK